MTSPTFFQFAQILLNLILLTEPILQAGENWDIHNTLDKENRFTPFPKDHIQDVKIPIFIYQIYFDNIIRQLFEDTIYVPLYV